MFIFLLVVTLPCSMRVGRVRALRKISRDERIVVGDSLEFDDSMFRFRPRSSPDTEEYPTPTPTRQAPHHADSAYRISLSSESSLRRMGIRAGHAGKRCSVRLPRCQRQLSRRRPSPQPSSSAPRRGTSASLHASAHHEQRVGKPPDEHKCGSPARRARRSQQQCSTRSREGPHSVMVVMCASNRTSGSRRIYRRTA